MRTLCAGLILTMTAVATASCSGDLHEPAPDPADEQARLVVAIVYDQFPAWAYEKYADSLSPDGALQRLRTRGADHRVEYSFASTHTAPGHTSIFTGAPPSIHGVPTNQAWTAERGIRSIVDDGAHAALGVPGASASPEIVRVDSVADALRAAHGDRARIAALAFKDRGAVLTGGRDPDLVLWYEKKIGAITSSTYYTDALPDWVSSWVAENPIENYFEDWLPRDPELLQRLLGPDNPEGKADYRGFGATFPHNPATTTDPNRTFRLAPQSADHLLDLARVTVARLGLGDDDVPDLLVLSISSTDYSGHVFGPGSWEYVDNLIRVDEAVGAFLAELERKTSLAVLITSDHGGAPLPERSRDSLPDAGRVYPNDLPVQMNVVVAGVLGEGDWVGPYVPPFLHLTAAASTPDRRERAMTAMIEALEAMPEVYAAYDVGAVAGHGSDPDPIKRSVALSISDPNLDAVFVVHGRGSVADEGFEVGKGTGHGSPWAHDRQVPVLFAGPGVTNTSSTTPLEQTRVAATLCSLLGIAPPEQIRALQPLPGS
jgi:hypothetical protein